MFEIRSLEIGTGIIGLIREQEDLADLVPIGALQARLDVLEGDELGREIPAGAQALL